MTLATFRIAPRFLLVLFAFAVLAMPLWGASRFRLIDERSFGAPPSAIGYAEYEYAGKIISVITASPQFFAFKVAYANPPKSVERFHEENPEALLTVNGGYWDHQYRPTDLCVADGRVIKPVNSMNRHHGLFAVGRDGGVVVRDLKGHPLGADEAKSFLHALKSGPHLVRNGEAVNLKSTSKAARTVIARDSRGNVLFVINRAGKMTYAAMADFLVNTHLDITEASTLDGGFSTGFALGRGRGRILKETWVIADVIQIERKKGR